MDVDISIDTTPDTANVAQEQFMALVELAKAGVQIPPQILIEASSLPKKREITEKMKAMGEQPNPAQEIEQAEKVAGVQKTQSETELNKAKTATMIGEAQVQAAMAQQAMAFNAPPPMSFPEPQPAPPPPFMGEQFQGPIPQDQAMNPAAGV
jgi:hypothetical protein